MLTQQWLEKYGIPASAMKTRRVPRILTAYAGPFKKEYLATTISMIVNGVLPEHGQKRRYRRDLTQDQLAQGTGLDSRSTFTRRLTQLQELPVPLLQGKRRFANPNIYTTNMPERQGMEYVVCRISSGRAVPRGRYTKFELALADAEARNAKGKRDYEVKPFALSPECFYYAVDDILSDKRVAHLFDPELVTAFVGYCHIPEWVWHPSLGISDTARLVLTYYIMCGLLTEKNKDTGHLKGYVQPKQPTVAKRLGLSVKTVYNANCELEAIGIVRVISQKRNKLGAGKFGGTPSKILFMPIRTMTDEEIKAERRRRVMARKSLHEVRRARRNEIRYRIKMADKFLQSCTNQDVTAITRARLAVLQEALQEHLQRGFTLALMASKAARVHNALTRSYKGKTCKIGALWIEANNKLASSGIDRRLITALIPSILSPPG